MMQRICVLMLILTCSSAYADWKEVTWEGDRAVYRSVRVFVDSPSIVRTGDTAKLSWLLDDPDGSNVKALISNRRVLFHFYSTTWSSEINCRKSEIRHLSQTHHAAPLGKGSTYE